MSYSGKFKDKNNNLHPVTSVLYGTCDTAASTAAKVVTCTDFDALMTGVTIRVKFTNANTAASPTVNINSTGAKSVYRFGSTAPVDANSWNAGEVVELVYDGTSFFMTNADNIGAKQDATDNNLTTTNKTVVGGINELKSGLTTLDNEVNGSATTYPYADVITINDAVPANLADCSVKVEPVQDLHGYDKPWVGGAGHNMADPSDMYLFNSNVYIATNDYNTAGSYDVEPNTEYRILSGKGLGSDLRVIFWDAEGNKISNVATTTFTTPNDCVKISFYAALSSAVQTVADADMMICLSQYTDYEPYANICPISGHTEASVQRDGKNLCSVDSSSFTAVATWCNLTGGNANAALDGTPIKLKAGSYAIRPFNHSNMTVLQVYNSAGTKLCDALTQGASFTLASEETVYIRIMTSGSGSAVSFNTMLAVGISVDAYEPYRGQTYTIAFKDGQGNTVTLYGAEGNVNTGAFTVTHEFVEYDGDADEQWTMYGSSSASAYAVKKMIPHKTKSFSDIPYVKTNELETIALSSTWGNYDAFICQESATEYNRQFIICGVKDVSTSVEAWETYLQSHPLQVCYELATPFTLNLDPTKIQLLQGTNILYCSTGDISVTVNGVAGAIGELTEAMTPYKQFSFDGTPDANGMIVTTCPLADYIPMTVFNPARDGWYYEFVKYTAVSSTYWLVKVFNANAESGVFGGKILAIKNTVV